MPGVEECGGWGKDGSPVLAYVVLAAGLVSGDMVG